MGPRWAEVRGVDWDQVTLEAFCQFSISPGLQNTPSFQFIEDPMLNPAHSSVTLIGLRAQIAS
ncbi:hypothetical protein [Ruegeria sp. Alg231-54]|uniref:hypothetical protein n=1 Tax=Ruegeria sp. Alg231-54 TaxID=1922221 RepID=UPI000D55800C|nr:hypothetical protein [Ruegeria sp. Alg231-54]